MTQRKPVRTEPSRAEPFSDDVLNIDCCSPPCGDGMFPRLSFVETQTEEDKRNLNTYLMVSANTLVV